MQKLKRSLILVMIYLLISQFAVCAETIYTKDGQEIKGKITEVTEDTVWVETTDGEVSEETGVDRANVLKILNDDGSRYNYSSTEKKG